CPCGSWFSSHRFEQVRGHISLGTVLVGFSNDDLLKRGDLLDRNLAGQITSVNQHRVRLTGNLRQIVQTADALDLRDDDRFTTRLVADQIDVGSTVGDRKRKMANSHSEANGNGGAILF